MDPKTGFHQIRLTPKDIQNTVFDTKYGQFEYLVMPMGLSNAPATFQSLINRICYDFIKLFLVVHMDDLLIFINCKTEQLKHLKKIFPA